MPSHVPNLLDPDVASTAAQRAEYAASLRQLADWVESTEFPVHHYGLSTELVVYSSWYDDQSFVQRVGSAAKLIGGRVEKGADSWEHGHYWLRRDFGAGVRFRFNISRAAVCTPVEKIVVVEEDVPVDGERAAQLKAEFNSLETVKAMVPKTVTEFECPPSLLGLEQERST